MKIPQEVLVTCKRKLIETKAELLNRIRMQETEFYSRDRGGDEVDQTVQVIAETHFMANQDRLRNLLLEIEIALARIEAGKFGVCEETDEMIEIDRLKALPWTRLSIEGAEIREALSRRFAR